jgi:7,8-dihydroneopterin aldolase/epimerase/oxygenase
VFVRALTVDAILGILPHERENPQPVRISFAMATDTRAAAASEDIDTALDYAKAAERVAALTREGRFQLVETLAEHIAQLLLHEFPIQRVRVEVEKPQAIAAADSVGVSIERRSTAA